MSDLYFRYHPVVFAVGDDYRIFFCVDREGLAWVQIGDVRYSDTFCGVVRSRTLIHSVTVPMAVLDAAGSYTVAFAPLPERVSYFNKPGDPVCRTYRFCPVPAENARFALLCDTHGNVAAPARMALTGGRPDALLLGGDIGDSADTEEQILTVHRLAHEIAAGEIPVVYARGNHDTRGALAEKLGDYVATRDGKTYFTFRLGSVFGIVLDGGEDKRDGCPEYGGVADYPAFRRAQTAFLRELAAHKEQTLNAPGVRHRILLCHMPFTLATEDYIAVAGDDYADWVRAVNGLGVDLALFGHMHALSRHARGEDNGGVRADFPVVVAAALNDHPDRLHSCQVNEYTGTSLAFSPDGIRADFINSQGEIIPL